MTRDDIARQLVIMVSRSEPARVLVRVLEDLRHLSPEFVTGWSLTSEQGGEDLVQLYQFPVPPSQELIERLNEPGVLLERNMTMSQAARPNDTLYTEQWALTRMSAEAAWDCVVAGGPTAPITVAVIDSGIARSHPDLGALVHPLSTGFVGARLDAEDEDGHGTFLAGTIGAITDNNAIGIASATWPIAVNLLALKFYNLSNPLNAAYACQAIAYAVLHGAKVINLSWHLGMYSQALFNHMNHPSARDVLFVAAAGNEGTDNDLLPVWPASYGLRNLISVMATSPIPVMAIDQNDDKPGFSNYGRRTVHIAAPGVRVLSTHYGFSTQPPKWRNYTGTSVAAAHVTAAAALVRALRPLWKPHRVRERLMDTVDNSRYLRCIAGGRLNLERALCNLPP